MNDMWFDGVYEKICTTSYHSLKMISLKSVSMTINKNF